MATGKPKASLSAKKKVDGAEGRRTPLYMDLILKFLNKIRCCVVGVLLESFHFKSFESQPVLKLEFPFVTILFCVLLQRQIKSCSFFRRKRKPITAFW